ncbi:MAG: hypothetical protein ACI4A5_06330 [Hominilimicola sp.]
MRLIILNKEKQKKAIAYLSGLAQAIHKNNLIDQNIEVYTFCIEALAELSYIIGGLHGMNTVKHYGLDGGEEE